MPDDNNSDGIGQTKRYINRRRKQRAKRACLACRRSHSTCGDDRPCERCIKRNITDACQDDVHKALKTVSRPSWDAATATDRQSAQQQNSSASNPYAPSIPSRIFSSHESGLAYPSGDSQDSATVPDSIQLSAQSFYVSPTFQDNPAVSQPQMGSMVPPNHTDFNAFFDPSNPVYSFVFDFGSEDTCQELKNSQKATIGSGTPPRESSPSQTSTSEANYATLFSYPSFEGNAMMADFSGMYQINPFYNTNEEGNKPEKMNRDGLYQTQKHYDTRERKPAYTRYNTENFVGWSDSTELNPQTSPVSSTIQEISQSERQCWDHDCSGRQFSTLSNLRRHQREKSGKATMLPCPKCDIEFTRMAARNKHLREVCPQRRKSHRPGTR